MSSLLRFTLDLFSPEALPPLAAKPKKADAAPRKPTTPPCSESLADLVPNTAADKPGQAQTAPENIAAAEPLLTPVRPQTLADAWRPGIAAHPLANREAVLGTLRLGYVLRRGKRRTIGFSVGADGLTVSAPGWVKLGDIDQALKGKSAWILRKLHEVRARHDQLASARIIWQDGALLPYLGCQVRVVIDPARDFAGVGAQLQAPAADATARPGAPDAQATPRCLYVGLQHNASAEQIQGVVQAWLMRQATRVFTERLQHFAPQLGVSWRKLSLSSAGTRWGSASSDGSVRLHWRLIHFRQPVIDYVVVHELSHLRVMDHSPRFWDTVRAVVPDYAALRGELKEEAIARW